MSQVVGKARREARTGWRQWAAAAIAVLLVPRLVTAVGAPPVAAEGFVIIDTLAGGGNPPDGLGDGGPATDAALSLPREVVADSAGNVYVSDAFNNSVRKVDTSGIITTFAGGNDPNGPIGDGGPATGAALQFPEGLAVDVADNVYIASSNRIRKVDTAGTITTVAGGGEPPDGLGDGGPATLAALSEPIGVAVDGTGTIYIGDQQNARVRRVDPSGTITTHTDQIGRPSDVAVDGTGQAYVITLTDQIFRLDSAGAATLVAGGGTGGDGGPAADAFLFRPASLAFDAAGNLYIAERAANRIRKVGTSGVITTVAGTGTEGFAGDGGPPELAQFNGPAGVGVDGTGGLLIGDTYNYRVRHVHRVTDGLAVAMSAAHVLNVGEQVTFDISVVNNGTGPATGSVLAHVLPATFGFDAAAPSQGTCWFGAGTRTVTCDLGTLGPDASAMVAVTATPTATGTFDSTVRVAATEAEPLPVNNSASLSTLVGAPGCGRVITANTTLQADVGPCPATGLVVGKNGVRLDLGGHRVFGFPGKTDIDSIGILLPGRTGVVVRNGTVSDFDAGMYLEGGRRNTVTRMTLRDNVGMDDPFVAQFGDGILLYQSARNRITANVVTGNGIFDGIGVLGERSDGNVIAANTVSENLGPSDGGPAGNGIIVNAYFDTNTLEVIRDTRIVGNTIQRNGSGGIANVNSVGGEILSNVVEENGHANFQGNGIGVQTGPQVVTNGVTNMLIKDNRVRRNAQDGIQIRRTSGNRIIDNLSTRNGGPKRGQDFFDLDDINFDEQTGERYCADNIWSGNTWGSGLYRPACVTVGGSGPAFPASVASPAGPLRSPPTGPGDDSDLPLRRRPPTTP